VGRDTVASVTLYPIARRCPDNADEGAIMYARIAITRLRACPVATGVDRI
jgi:hypothetical protein